jgi:phosphomannomutase
MTKKINVNSLMTSSGVIFGTSGLRGLVAQMSDELCYAYVTAFLQKVVGHNGPIGSVVLGHDLRPSSPQIAKACASAIIDAGGQVVYAGALPTPAIAFYAMTTKLPAVIVTGSHIPFDRNGIKFYRTDGEISKDDEHVIQYAEIEVPNELLIAPLPPVNQLVEDLYVKRYVNFFGINHFKGLRVASYEHSSVARDLLFKILNILGAEVVSLGRTESFVPIDTEAVRPEDVMQAKKWAHEYDFDAILSTDGDADRPLIGDEQGQWLRGDIVGILCGKFLAIDTIVTPVSSNTLTDKLGWFKRVIRTKIGSPYVVAGMEQAMTPNKGYVAGFEANGGFLLASEINRNGKTLSALPTRDAVLPMLALISFARELKCKLSELVSSLPNCYTASNRLQNFPTQNSAKLLDMLHQNHQFAGKLLAPNSGDMIAVDLTDGFRATFSNGDIVHLRPSGNAPELRCYAESDLQVKSQSLCDLCLIAITNELHIT